MQSLIRDNVEQYLVDQGVQFKKVKPQEGASDEEVLEFYSNAAFLEVMHVTDKLRRYSEDGDNFNPSAVVQQLAEMKELLEFMDVLSERMLSRVQLNLRSQLGTYDGFKVIEVQVPENEEAQVSVS